MTLKEVRKKDRGTFLVQLIIFAVLLLAVVFNYTWVIFFIAGFVTIEALILITGAILLESKNIRDRLIDKIENETVYILTSNTLYKIVPYFLTIVLLGYTGFYFAMFMFWAKFFGDMYFKAQIQKFYRIKE